MFGKKRKFWTVMYKSISRIDNRHIVEELWFILRISNYKNIHDNITGLLVYDQGRFFQILEGPREAVTACYTRIGEDARHGHLETLIDQPVAHRTFEQWSMGFVDAMDLDDYLTLHRGLHSKRPGDVFDTMARMGVIDRMS